MPVLTATNVTKYYGADLILDRVSFNLDNRDRVGLVGRNGGGKSTLLAIIRNEVLPDEGSVSLVQGATCSMLVQDPEYCFENSIWEQTAQAFSAIRHKERRLRQVEAEIEAASREHRPVDDLLKSYARLEEQFGLEGGYTWEYKQASVLTGLGFTQPEFGKKMGALSSGQRIRVALATTLLMEPDILLLDEPTNHLDVDAAEWLEEQLRAYPGAVISVSHDKYFLNAVCTRIFELENANLTETRGNYDQYLLAREQRFLNQEREYERATKKEEQLKHYIRRYQAGNRATMAKSRAKWLARLAPARPPAKKKNIGISFSQRAELGKQVFCVEGLSKNYGEHQVFRDANFRVLASDRLGIIGKNGAGKTTLIKTLMGYEQPTRGSVRIAASASIAYFWQDLDALNPDNDVLTEMMEGTHMLPAEARMILGRFLFTGDDVYKQVSVLSGGEKNRLTLAKIVVSGCNVLVLDEPTNHLDVDAKDALARALVEFGGCVLFVTHDRQFLEDVATKILELEHCRVSMYEGNYSLYKEAKRTQVVEQKQSLPDSVAQREPERSKSAAKPAGDSVRRELRRRAHESAVEDMQQQIAELERERDAIWDALCDPEVYKSGAAQDMLVRQKQIEHELRAKYEQWETLEMNPPE